MPQMLNPKLDKINKLQLHNIIILNLLLFY